ncbi:MAG TPA: hypothetical protein PKW98_03230 [Candidatus Wallbacteria bacterium]|nr:MAG: hypothetical protein BWY32_00639 [bacterium ADurb.Bin243]HOD41560.1 hypothetical protein [Candidatus Wallbacteria bacterium]HPG56809.1 hypothetical protein [Candidatus Wallbacteria bacterium]
MRKNYNNKKRRYQRYFLFAAALISLIILINIGLIYAGESKPAVKGELIIKIDRGEGGLKVLEPSAFTVDSSENILVCDSGSQKVLMINTSNKSVSKSFSYADSGIGRDYISDMAVSKSGFIYLADAETNLIHKFSGEGKHIGVVGSEKGEKHIKKIKYIFTDNSSNLVAIDSLEHKISVFDEDMKLTGEIRIPLSNKIFSYVRGGDDSNCVYISSLKDNTFSVMNAKDPDKPVYSEKCSPEHKDAIIADCYVIGFDARNNAYVKAYLVDKNGKEVAHYLVKFDREKKSYIKVRIAPQADKSRIKILKKFVVLSEDTVLSYEKDETSFRLIKYKF